MKVGLFIGKEELEGEFRSLDAIDAYENGYDHIILETTPMTYKRVREMCEPLAARGLSFHLAFPVMWKYQLYDYSTISELVETYSIDRVYAKLFEGVKLPAKEIAEKLAEIPTKQICLQSAIYDPTLQTTNTYAVFAELLKTNNVDTIKLSPYIFGKTTIANKKGWIVGIFVKDINQDEFDVMLQGLKEEYEEVFLFPYKNAYDLVVRRAEKAELPEPVTEFLMECALKTHSRVSPSLGAKTVRLIKPGEVCNLLERFYIDYYQEFARIGENEWVIVRNKGMDYFRPVE